MCYGIGQSYLLYQIKFKMENDLVIKELQQTNAALQDLFDNSNDLIFVCSLEGDLLFSNKVFREKLGYFIDDLKDINLKNIIAEDYKSTTYAQISAVFEGEDNISFQTAVYTSKRQLLHLSGRLNARREDNKILAFRGILNDITDKVLAEKQLSSQTARLNAIFESGSHLMWTVSRERKFTAFNNNYAKAVEEQYGIIPQLNQPLETLKNAIAQEQVDTFWKDKFKAAFLGKVQHFEIKVIDKNGILRWREVYLNPIYTTEFSSINMEENNNHNNQNIQEVAAIAHNITEKKLSEIALKESEEKFRNIFISFQDIYYRSDLKGVIQMISPSIYELGGYLPEEMLGKKVTDFYVLESNSIANHIDILEEASEYINRYFLKKAFRNLFKNGKLRNFEVGLRCKDGNVVESMSNIRLIFDDFGKPFAIEGVIRDITELKKTERKALIAKELAEKSLKVKGSFLANMSHEIRTPMNGIIGMIDLLSGTALSTKQQEYVQIVKKSSETLLTILNDILDLSKIEAGKMQLNEKNISLKNTIDKIYALFKQQAESKHNQLKFSFENDVPDAIFADETRLLQILSNLVSNAIKFTESGKITIYTEIEKVLENNLKNDKNQQEIQEIILKISVKDTGIGISKENLDKLFYSFSQVDNSFSKSYGGTGLGLVISKELSNLMNGEMGVSSEIGKGSCFYFTFKTSILNISKENLTNSSANNLLENNQNSDNFTKKSNDYQEITFFDTRPFILIVDDNAINRRVAGDILEKSGCSIDFAESGFVCLEKVQKNQLENNKHQRYAIILMDIQMPDLDGVATMKILHQKEKENLAENTTENQQKVPPIVAMTAYAMVEDREKFLKNGFDDYISKPIRAEILLKTIQKILSQNINNQIDNQIVINKIINEISCEIVNKDVLQQLKKYGGDELVLESLKDFEIEAKSLIESCEFFIKNDDFRQLASHIHTLKGNAGTLGADDLAEKATIIDKDMKEKEYLANDTNYQENLHQNFQNLKKSFEIWQTYFKENF